MFVGLAGHECGARDQRLKTTTHRCASRARAVALFIGISKGACDGTALLRYRGRHIMPGPFANASLPAFARITTGRPAAVGIAAAVALIWHQRRK